MGAIRSRVLHTSSHTVNSMRTVKIFMIAVALTLGSPVSEFSEVLSSAAMGNEVEAMSKAKTKTTYGGTISGAVSFVANGAFSGGFAHMEEEELELELPQLEGKAKAEGEAALSEVTCNSGAKFKIATSGGQKNCAKCSQAPSGALFCKSASLFLGKYYTCSVSGRCAVEDIASDGKPTAASLTGQDKVTHKWNGLFDDTTKNEGTVISRVQIARPPFAERNIGVIAFKRVVMDKNGKADSFKQGICVKCPGNYIPFKTFSIGTAIATDEEMTNFYKLCFLPFKAKVESGGDTKTFQCPGQLQGRSELWHSEKLVHRGGKYDFGDRVQAA